MAARCFLLIVMLAVSWKGSTQVSSAYKNTWSGPFQVTYMSDLRKYHLELENRDAGEGGLDGACTVKIAAVDLDGDGVYGLALFADGGSFCCGARGCTFRLFENGDWLRWTWERTKK